MEALWWVDRSMVGRALLLVESLDPGLPLGGRPTHTVTGSQTLSQSLQDIATPCCSFGPRKVRAKKPSLTITLGDQRLENDYRATTNGCAGGLLTRTESPAVTHPSSSRARRCLTR
ncbi:hypothetical protein J6590_022761, partial [Homalodisca vitripennis]